MNARSDALVAASWMVTSIRNIAQSIAEESGYHFAATVGEFSMEPNAANVVPSRVRFLIDARAERRSDMEEFIETIGPMAEGVAKGFGCTIQPPLTISDNPPTALDPDVLDILDQSASAVGARHRRMASGAGHDTAWMARMTKAAMIFIPCRDGRSHSPEEFAETADIALGAAVLLEAVKRLDDKLG
jgi:N-carbamoyl-L-amino-acid hydrolase